MVISVTKTTETESVGVKSDFLKSGILSWLELGDSLGSNKAKIREESALRRPCFVCS